MRSRTSFRVLVIVALFTLLIPLAVPTPGAAADGDDDQYAIPEKVELKYPNLESMLNQLVARVEEGEASAQEAAEETPVHREASVAVTIHLSGNVDDVAQFLEDNGGDSRNVGEDYIEAYVPVSLLGPVSEQPGVLKVRTIVPPEPDYGDFTSQGVQVHGSSGWNQAGYSGEGIKVGIIDSGFEGFRDLMGTELPAMVQARCYTDIGDFTQNLADCEADDDHGTAVAEAVIDIAPEVSLYIAHPRSKGDLQAAADWMVLEGVSVINHSVGWSFDGPGDGTSPYSDSPLRTVDRAVAGGSIWVNSAGNDAQKTWFGPPSVGSLGIMYFSGFDIANDMLLEAGEAILVDMRWDDRWGGATRDFDVCVFHRDIQGIGDCSFDLQSGGAGHVPREFLRFESLIDGPYQVVVFYYSGNLPAWLQLRVRGGGVSIEHYTAHHSISNPGESANPGMLAVGAAPWDNVHTIEPYSSRGPTPDGRTKPEIVGVACGETSRIPLDVAGRGFCGTSQASPHVAGMAALVRQRFPDFTPVEVANYLKENAEQRESPDPNNTWGHGFAKLPAVDRAALEALYNATGGDNWANNDNWLSDAPIGQWLGVTTGPGGRVTVLNLTENQLSGAIPAELGSLTNLQRLYLSNNLLTGEIPAELGRLINLEGLHLSGNQLTGPIPAELANLSNLELLALGGNQLTGKIPAWLGSLANLQGLYLWGNELTGEIPTELGGLSNLERLSLTRNQLTGTVPAWLGSLANLQELYLWGNELTGEIPTELGSLTNLTTLSLSENQLTGEIPTELANLSNLERLNLGGNQLTGTVPAWLGSLANLQELYLWGNQLTGEIPTELGGLSNLTILSLSENQLTGPIPSELGGLTNLQTLWLYGNELTGSIPAELGGLPSLERLSLSENQLTGEIPTELANLSNLERLNLGGNQMTGTVPAWLGSLANLQELYLWGNQLTGEIPTELGSLTSLQGLYLAENQLTGPIPSELGGLTNLQTLWLYGNELTGSIPEELGGLPSLEWLNLSENQLTGPIPSELGNLANLQNLNLNRNQLTGEMPGELGNLANLRSLWLSGNQLTGEIPAELGNLTNLQSLNLNRNQLTGEMPSELGGLTNLEWLDLWENQLTGPIPAVLGSLTNLQGLDLTLNQLTGEIPTELANLTNLEVLALGGNQLTGTVPAWLGSLANLQELYLWGNELTGPIPSELGGLANLQTLDLWENELTGPIPSELGGLPSLEWLDLSDNQLTGPIPAELGGLTNLEHLSLSQNMLTGCVPEAWRDIAESDVPELGLPFCTVSLNTAPVFSDSEGNPITEVGRSVVENTAAGENVGAPVTATDVDMDIPTYTLGGEDAASFDIDSMTGQLMTKAPLDFEAEPEHTLTVMATDPSGASAMISVTVNVTNVEEPGTVTLDPERPVVGEMITANLDDPDGDVTGDMWQWAKRSMDMTTWDDIPGATAAAYTPVEGDDGYYLRATAMYDDGEGMGKMASEETMMVGAEAGDQLLAEYDPNGDGVIEKADMRKAVAKFFKDPPDLTREEMRRLVAIFFR